MKTKGQIKVYLAILDKRADFNQSIRFGDLDFVRAFTQFKDLETYISEYKAKHPKASFFTPTTTMEVTIEI